MVKPLLPSTGAPGEAPRWKSRCLFDGAKGPAMPLSAPERFCILVADDEAPARQRIIDLLRRDRPTAVILEASDGLSAVGIIQERRPELVFLDVQMPELTGL